MFKNWNYKYAWWNLATYFHQPEQTGRTFALTYHSIVSLNGHTIHHDQIYEQNWKSLIQLRQSK